MLNLRDDLYIIKESSFDSKGLLIVPPKEIKLKPSPVSFSDKFLFESLEDKKYDNTILERISCYNSIERAIQMTNMKDNRTCYCDVYSPVQDTSDSSSMYPYEYLINRGLIKDKKPMDRETWFVKPTSFKFMGSIKLLANNKYEPVIKDYQITDLDKDALLEGNYFENSLARKELGKRKNLYKCTYELKRIILPNQKNYGNKLSKERNSSYWWTDSDNAIINFLIKHLSQKGIISYEDFSWLYNIKLLYLNRNLKEDVIKEILNTDIYLNIIEIPSYSILSGKHMGFGWDIKDLSYTYDKSVFVDISHHLNIDDIIQLLRFVDDEKLKNTKFTSNIIMNKRKFDHALIFDINKED